MEQSPKTSFIPKQGSAGSAVRQRRSFNALTFFAMVTFLAVLILSAGIFFYERYTVQKLDEKKEELTTLRSSFSESDIESIRTLERRLKNAKVLLDQHLSLTRVFDALEDRTQTQTALSKFAFMRLPSGKAQVTLAGTSASFNTLALQKRAYAGEKSFVQGSVLFSNLNVSGGEEEEERVVTFEVSADVDATAVAYTVTASSTDESASSTMSAEAVPVLIGTTTMPVVATSTNTTP